VQASKSIEKQKGGSMKKARMQDDDKELEELNRILSRLKVYSIDYGERRKIIEVTIAIVLSKLPSNVREKTLDEVVFINMYLNGGIMFWTKIIERLKMKAIIFLCPRPTCPEPELMGIIAHEIAHFMLNHLRFKKHFKTNETREKEADDLAVEWGFKPSKSW
jgi:hypothetical protein